MGLNGENIESLKSGQIREKLNSLPPEKIKEIINTPDEEAGKLLLSTDEDLSGQEEEVVAQTDEEEGTTDDETPEEEQDEQKLSSEEEADEEDGEELSAGSEEEQTELEKANKRIEDKEKEIKRLGRELGDTRKQVAALDLLIKKYLGEKVKSEETDEVTEPVSMKGNKKLEDVFNKISERAGSDVAELLKEAIILINQDHLTQAKRKEIEQINLETRNKEIILAEYPDFEDMKPVIAELARTRDVSEVQIQKFLKNPYAFNINELRTYAEKVLRLAAEEEAKRRKAKKTGEAGKSETIDKIKKATKTSVGGANGSSPKRKSSDKSDISGLTPKDLNFQTDKALLKKILSMPG